MKTLINSPRLNSLFYCYHFFTNGIAYGLFAVTLPAYLAQRDVSAAAIAVVLLMSNLPGALKVLGGPIADRLHFFAMGRRRTWVIFSRIARILTLFSVLLLDDITHQLTLLSIFIFTYNVFNYFEFVALDAQMVETNPPERYNRLSGYTRATILLGVMVGAGGVAIVLTNMTNGWYNSILIIIAVMLVGFFFSLLLRERESDRIFSFKRATLPELENQSSVHSFKEVFADLWQISRQKLYRNFIIYLLLAFIPSGILYALAPILAVKGFNWSDKFYSQFFGMIYSVVGIGTALIGSWFATRKGSSPVLKVAMIIGSITLFAMACLQPYWHFSQKSMLIIMASFSVTFALIDTLNAIVSIGLMMKLTFKRIAGTQFGLFLSLYYLSIALGDGLFGIIQHWLDYQQILIFVSFFYLIILSYVFKLDRLLPAREEKQSNNK